MGEALPIAASAEDDGKKRDGASISVSATSNKKDDAPKVRVPLIKGDRVSNKEETPVRIQPRETSTVVSVAKESNSGTVLSEPAKVKNDDWQKVQYDDDVTGWVPSVKLNKNAYATGTAIKVLREVRVRNTPGLNGRTLGEQNRGALGTIIDGPVTKNSDVWYKIDYKKGKDGWSIARNIGLVSTSTVPTPVPPTPVPPTPVPPTPVPPTPVPPTPVPPTPVADTQAPTVPSGLGLTVASQTQINLAWSASTDNTAVTGYKVFRNGTQIATVTSTSYQSTGLTAGTAYAYTVSAYDAAGNSSAQSASVSATTQSPAPTPVLACGNGGTCTAADIAPHNTKADCWVYLSPLNKAYNITGFLNPGSHPAGSSIIVPQCGKNIYDYFITGTANGGWKHSNNAVNNVIAPYYIGVFVP